MPAQFKSREWDEQDRFLLARHLQLPRDESSPNWRLRFTELLKTRKCLHVQRHVVETETPYGIWVHEICAECGEHVKRTCAHVRSTWQNNGTALICDNCGSDGT